MDATTLNRANRAEHTARAAATWLAPADAYALYYGNARSPLCRVVPDIRYPGMWRVAWPDGQLSDMVNLARARDAAAAIAERGPPARDRRMFHWKKGPSKTGSEAPPITQSKNRGDGIGGGPNDHPGGRHHTMRL
jgi:hypothetical protein